MTRSKRLFSAFIAAATTVALLAGCARTVEGTAKPESGSGNSQGNSGGTTPPNNNSQQQYPNLQKECDVLSSDVIAKAVGADSQDIISTFVGAVCRWQALNPGGLIDITRYWFEQGNLQSERQTATKLKYQVENRTIAGVASILMRPSDPNGACGVASEAMGVVGWWVNPQTPGLDACAMALKLMELTLATSA
jgi:Protein of unknown function (DUF3558)